MGIPFRSYFGAIVALQLGSLAGFVWLVANQYQLQNQLWQIQTQLEIPGNIKLQTKGFETLASGSGDPSGGPSPLTGVEAKGDPQRKVVVVPDSFSVNLSLGQLAWGLVISLIGLLVLGFFLTRRERVGEGVIHLSPKAQRDLAQRQLAEVRLKRHVFGREASTG